MLTTYSQSTTRTVELFDNDIVLLYCFMTGLMTS